MPAGEAALIRKLKLKPQVAPCGFFVETPANYQNKYDRCP